MVLILSGEDGIRTHVPFQTNGFQDRPVTTASVPLQMFCLTSLTHSRLLVKYFFVLLFLSCCHCTSATSSILPSVAKYVNNFFQFFKHFLSTLSNMLFHLCLLAFSFVKFPLFSLYSDCICFYYLFLRILFQSFLRVI